MTTLSVVLGRGTYASIPAAATTPVGALYYATDKLVMYRNNGASWDVASNDITAASAVTVDPSADYIAFYDASGAVIAKALFTNFARERLTADRNYYVRTDGSNSNTGLVNSAGGAWLTLQYAWDYVLANIDLAGYSVLINVIAGTYTTATACVGCPVGKTSTNYIRFIGDTTTPTNVVLSTTSANCFTAGGGALVQIGGFQIKTTTSGHGLVATGMAQLTVYEKMDFGAVAAGYAQMLGDAGGLLSWGSGINYTISGGGGYHFYTANGAQINAFTRTITLSGTPAFTIFAYGDSLGKLNAYSITFSGSATGKRYQVDYNAYIHTNGGGASYFPGNSAGSTSNGGLYR